MNQQTLQLITATQSLGYDIAGLKTALNVVRLIDRTDFLDRLNGIVDRRKTLLDELVALHRSGESNGFLAFDQELYALRGAIRQIAHEIQARRSHAVSAAFAANPPRHQPNTEGKERR